MQDFLQQTLSGEVPRKRSGETAHLRWQWLYHGILLMEPTVPVMRQALSQLVRKPGAHQEPR